MWQFVLLRQLLLWLTTQTSISFMYYLQQSHIALYLDYTNIQCMHVHPVTSVVSDFLWLDGPQSARFLCPGDSPISVGYWSVLSYPPPGDLFNPVIEPVCITSPALGGGFFTTRATSVQFSYSVVSDSLRPHESQHATPPCPSPTPGVYSKLMSTESVIPSSHLILCLPLLLLPPIPPIRVFSNESTLRMRWPEYWSFSFSISPSNEHPELTSFTDLHDPCLAESPEVELQVQRRPHSGGWAQATCGLSLWGLAP